MYFVWSGRFLLLLLPDQARCFLLLLPYLADVTGLFYFVFVYLFGITRTKIIFYLLLYLKLFGFDSSIVIEMKLILV